MRFGYSAFYIALVSSLCLTGCFDATGSGALTLPSPPPKVISVTIAPRNAWLAVGEDLQLTATVIANAGVSTTVTWFAGGGIVSVDSLGKVHGIAPGTTEVHAVSTVQRWIVGTAIVTVTP